MIHDVRDYAAQQGVGEIEVAFEEGMQETKSSGTILNARFNAARRVQGMDSPE